LVSVRGPDEVEAALEGGADIIDAKDPSRGPLGPLDPTALAGILGLVPARVPVSAAIGDPPDEVEAATLVGGMSADRRAAASYVKLGFAGVATVAAAERVLRSAVEAAARQPARAGVIAVAYADAPADAVNLESVRALAVNGGAAGVLLDTRRKEAGTLLDALPYHRLREWVSSARRAGLLVALAGRLDLQELAMLAGSDATIVGVRGAACEGGRGGTVSAARVRRLRAVLHAGAEPEGPSAVHQSMAFPDGR
jgi:uncharacterized protein (UPF0264 family)